MTRKNALFTGKETGAENRAMLASLVATYKLSAVNPVDHLADTLRANPDGQPSSRIENLMARRYAQPCAAAPHRAKPSRLLLTGEGLCDHPGGNI